MNEGAARRVSGLDGGRRRAIDDATAEAFRRDGDPLEGSEFPLVWPGNHQDGNAV